MTSKNLLKAALLGLFVALIFGSCKKDVLLNPSSNEELPLSPTDYRAPSSGAWHFTMEEVRQYFEEKQAEVAGGTFTMGSDTVRQAMANAELLWGFADTVLYAGSVEVLIVPVKAPEPSQLALGKEAYFIFFDEWGSLNSRLMLIWADEDYISENAGAYPNNFSGYIIQFTWDGVIDYSLMAEEGQIVHWIQDEGLVEERIISCYPGELTTIVFISAHIYAAAPLPIPLQSRVIYCLPTGGYSFDGLDWLGLGNTNNQNLPGNNNSGINAYYIGNFFDLSQFSGEQYLMAQAVNKFKETYGLAFSGPALWDMIQQNCSAQFGEVGPNPLVFFHQLNGFLSAPAGAMNACLQEIIEDNALSILSQGFELNLNEQQLHEIFSMDCIYSGDFEECALGELVGWIGQWVEYTDEQEAWIRAYPHVTPAIVNYILNNQNNPALSDMLKEAFDFLEEKGFDEASYQAVEAILSLENDGLLAGPYTEAQRDAVINAHFLLDPDLYAQYVMHCILLRAEWENEHPGQQCNGLCQTGIALEAYWKTVRGIVHTAFDVCGLVPVAGEPCDLINGALYLIEGDGVNAGLSFAATIPFLGWVATGAKHARIAVKITDNSVLEFLVKLNAAGKITFPLPTGKTFRQIVGVTDPLDEAHHLVPQALWDHDLVQYAASAKRKTFHMHHPKNGMATKKYRIDYQTDGIHANHPNYNSQVNQKMTDLIDDLEQEYGVPLEQIDPNVVSERLIDFQNSLRSLIESNPNTKINDLVIP